MKRLFISAAVVVTVLSCYSCKETPEKVNLTKEVTFTKEGELTLLKSTTNSTKVIIDIEIADTEYETQTGLMNRVSMQNNQGMLFIFPDSQPRSFYMKNTLISLDIIYIDDQMKIVSFQKNAKPMDESSLPSGTPAKYVLEINGGLSDQLQLEVGDKIIYNKN